ncbi:hypothetical protein AKJ16_DCAP12354, partial [Drosera capensis]
FSVPPIGVIGDDEGNFLIIGKEPVDCDEEWQKAVIKVVKEVAWELSYAEHQGQCSGSVEEPPIVKNFAEAGSKIVGCFRRHQSSSSISELVNMIPTEPCQVNALFNLDSQASNSCCYGFFNLNLDSASQATDSSISTALLQPALLWLRSSPQASDLKVFIPDLKSESWS